MQQWKKCYHWESPDSCGNKIIRAHTIQKNGVLKDILDDTNHCLTFKEQYLDSSGLTIPRRIGWRNATTFYGFCDYHDELFSEIETGNFVVNERNLLLAAYRVVTFELHQKEALFDSFEKFLTEHPELSGNVQFDSMFDTHREGLNNALIYSELISQDLQKKTSSLRHVAIEVKGQAEFLAAGTPSPGIVGAAPRLVPIGSALPPDTFLFISVHKQEGGFIWCISYPKHDDIAVAFVDMIIENENEQAHSILPHAFCQYCEHTFFSWNWWSQLSFDQRTALRRFAGDQFEEISRKNLVFTPTNRNGVKAYRI